MKRILYGCVLAFLLAVLAGFGGLIYLGQTSQGGTAPGLVDSRLAPCPSAPNCVSSETGTEGEKRVEPFPVDVWAKLPAAITGMGGQVTAQADSYIAAEFTSSFFGFVDDVEFRLEDNLVHVRSGSRVGHSDGGVNNARVLEIRKRLTP